MRNQCGKCHYTEICGIMRKNGEGIISPPGSAFSHREALDPGRVWGPRRGRGRTPPTAAGALRSDPLLFSCNGRPLRPKQYASA